METDSPDEIVPSRPKRFLTYALVGTLGFVCSLIGLTLLYIILGIGLGGIATEARVVSEPKDHIIYLETNGVHVDFIVPNDYLNNDPFLAMLTHPNSNYTAVGWGDKAFYLETPQWQDLTLKNFCRALFWKSDSLMHVSPYRNQQERWVPVRLSQGQLDELLAFMREAFVDIDGAPEVIPEASYYGDDRFYNAHGSYTLFYTCNNWTNEGLATIGESTAVWSPFDKAILEHAERNHKAFESIKGTNH